MGKNDSSPAAAAVSTQGRPARRPIVFGRSNTDQITTGTPPPAGAPLKVRALRLGFYDNARRRRGDVFLLNKREDFSRMGWMEWVKADTPVGKAPRLKGGPGIAPPPPEVSDDLDPDPLGAGDD